MRAAQEINKNALYGNFQKADDDRRKFARKVAYKAADMAMDDDVNITNTKTGIGTAGAIGIGAVAGIPGLLTALAMYFGGNGHAPAPQQPVQQVKPADSEYDVLFYDKDGNLIPVQRKGS